MKTNATQIILIRAILFILILLYSLFVFGRQTNDQKRMGDNRIYEEKSLMNYTTRQNDKYFVIVTRN